jgi:hypothetical protein
MVTGIDLIREQIRVAQGHKLPFTQDDITLKVRLAECKIQNLCVLAPPTHSPDNQGFCVGSPLRSSTSPRGGASTSATSSFFFCAVAQAPAHAQRLHDVPWSRCISRSFIELEAHHPTNDVQKLTWHFDSGQVTRKFSIRWDSSQLVLFPLPGCMTCCLDHCDVLTCWLLFGQCHASCAQGASLDQ